MKNKMVKRFLATLCVATMVIGSLAGCGSKTTSDDNGGEQSGDSESVTLSMYLATTWNTDALAKGISLYEEETGNKIELEVIPDDQVMELLKTRLATNTDVPDLVACNDEFVYEQIAQYFEPLEGDWTSRLNPEHVEGKYKQPSDGKFYYAPYGSASALGLIYNKQIMEENGIELPIMSYTDLVTACDKLKAAGVTPFSISNKEGWTAQILGLDQQMAQFTDQDFEDLKTGKLNYADNESLKTLLGNIVSLRDKGYINEDYMSTTMDMSIEDVATGECAMTPAGDWSYSVLTTNFPDEAENVGMMPIPISDDGIYVNIGISSKLMWATQNGKAENPEAAKEFIDFLMKDETLQAMYEVEAGICPIQGLEVNQNSWNAEMVKYAETIPYAKIAPLAGFNTGDFATAIQQLMGGKSVEDALKYWYDDCVQVNKAAGTEGF